MPARELVGVDELRTTVRRLAAEIDADHPDGALLVAILKGSVVFLSDLVRCMRVPVEVEFMAISHYAPDSGRVRIVKDLEVDVAGRDVVIVEDIVDTGLTLTYLLDQLRARATRRVEVCALLDRTRRRIVPVGVRYRGIPIDDEFVIGYGLDFGEQYRNLRSLAVGDVREMQGDPRVYAPELYGAFRGRSGETGVVG